MAYQRRLSRHKAQYSLDCDDGIEYSACLHEPTPQELLERMERFCLLWNALNSLPEAQGRRVDALNRDNFSWVLSRMALEVDARPRQYAEYDITTWVNE